MNLYEENKAKHKRIEEGKEAIIEMYREEKSIKAIAKLMGVSHPTIYYLLIKEGIIFKHRDIIKKDSAYRRRSEIGKDFRPFMERISPELKAQIESNTLVNNRKMKIIKRTEPTDESKELIGHMTEMEITDVVKRKGEVYA